MTANVLDISHLTLSIEHKTILQDIDLTIGAGETVALIGESGSCLLYTSDAADE